MNKLEFNRKFPNEECARRYFEKLRWGNNIECAHCGSKKISECKNFNPMPYRCKICRKHFSVRTNTILAESRLPLRVWLLSIQIITNINNKINIRQIANELEITQKSASFLENRIREQWVKSNQNPDKSAKMELVNGK